MQVSTREGAGAYVRLRQGQMEFRCGVCKFADFTQIWTTASEAVNEFTLNDKGGLLRAFEEGRCTLKGNFLIALWFSEAIKVARHHTTADV